MKIKLLEKSNLDAMFSPVKRATYKVENSRVGQVTDYDKLILESRNKWSCIT